MCEVCNTIENKETRGKFMAKKFLILREKIIDIINKNIYIPTRERLSFHLARFMIRRPMECGETRNDF